jgi:predicted phage terminase large subunit-like protein
VAIGDGADVVIYIEQEPGSGGKESAENTIRNLAGFRCIADRPTGDKIKRADVLAVQLNAGNVYILRGSWNADYKRELEYFPFGKYKDQVDASSGAFNMLAKGNKAKVLNY